MFQQSDFGFDGSSTPFGAGYAPAVALDPDTILSPPDVARAWGMSPAAVRNMIIAGDLPAEQDERGWYQIRAAELDRRPVVAEVTPAAELRKVTPEVAQRLHELHNAYADLVNRAKEALEARDRYIAELVAQKYGPTDIGRQLPGEGDAEHMSRSTVNRLYEKYRSE